MVKMASGNSLINPFAVLETANIGYGETVADLGIGAQGHFTLQAAHVVGDRGRVYAIDILKSVLQNVESRAKQSGLHNIIPVWSNLEVVGGAKQIHDHSVDAALIINVLFQTEHKELVFKEAKRMLKRGGKLVVIDWKKKGTPLGPQPHARVSAEEMSNTLQSCGFKIQQTFAPGDHHWGIIAST